MKYEKYMKGIFAMRRLSVLCFAAVIGAVDGAEMVRNGTFDECGGWSTDGKMFRIDERCGQNGTGGLAWENADPKQYRLVAQSLKLEQGRRYRYSCRVKTENLVSTIAPHRCGAQMCVAWNDSKGNWLAEVSAQQSPLGTTDWMEISGETPPMPENAATFSVSLYVGRGCTGKAWFDDVSVTPIDEKPVAFMLSDAYRDVAAAGDAVEFRVVLRLAAANLKPVDVKGEFAFEGSGEPFAVEATAIDGVSAAVKVPAERIAEGTHPVKFTLKTKDGRALGEAAMDFTRTVTLPRRKAYIDGKRRLIVDGKPFFPLGMYLSNVNSNMVEAYVKGPWNCCLPYQSGGKKELDFLASKGLKVIYGMSDYWGKVGRSPRYKTDDEAQAACRETVLKVKDHPAIIGWYVLDEMALKFMPRMLARQRMMREIDPDHPTWGVFFQYYQLREYMPVCDVLGTDPYPIGDCPISLPTEHMRTIRRSTFGHRSLWQVPQAFDWGWFLDAASQPARCRLPTAAEARSMAWQPIAGGANGVVFWAFHYVYWKLKGDAYNDFYGAYCRAGEEIRRFIPVILSDEAAPEVVAEPADTACRAWRKDGVAYLLVCNTSAKDVEAKVGLSERFASAVDLLDGIPAEARADGVSVKLPPMGVAMFRLGK